MVVFAALLLAASPVLLSQTDEKPGVKPTIPPTHADVSYGPDARNKLDLWCAKSDKPTPLVIYIHGGGWHGGDKDLVTDKFIQAMLDHGISVASIIYRFVPENVLPAPVYDAARAVQFLRSKAGEWNLDPKRFAAYGVSAGGCTTLWLACHDDLADPKSTDPIARESTRLQAAVGEQAQTSIDPEVVVTWVGPMVMNHGMIRRAVNVRTLQDIQANPKLEQLLKDFSPINFLNAGDPPILLTYPAVGPLPAANAGLAIHHGIFGVKFKEKADAVGADCTLKLEPKPEQIIEDFLVKKLGS